MIHAGAICLGLVLGTLVVQRLRPRALGPWRTYLAFAGSVAALAAACVAVVGTPALVPLLVATASGLLLRSLFDLSCTRGAPS